MLSDFYIKLRNMFLKEIDDEDENGGNNKKRKLKNVVGKIKGKGQESKKASKKRK
jgi:hypothetical protein